MENDKKEIVFTLEQIRDEIVKRWKASLDKYK